VGDVVGVADVDGVGDVDGVADVDGVGDDGGALEDGVGGALVGAGVVGVGAALVGAGVVGVGAALVGAGVVGVGAALVGVGVTVADDGRLEIETTQMMRPTTPTRTFLALRTMFSPHHRVPNPASSSSHVESRQGSKTAIRAATIRAPLRQDPSDPAVGGILSDQ
jgi:hypothetical protein